MTHHRNTRAPSKDERNLCEGHFGLRDLFFDDEIEDLINLARQRIVGVFRHFRKTTPRRPRDWHEKEFDNYHGVKLVRTIEINTDNYISGLDERHSALAGYIVKQLRNPFVNTATFNGRKAFEWLTKVPSTLSRDFYTHIQYKVLLLTVGIMCDDGEIWFDQGRGGLWQIKQSVVDEHLEARAVRRRAVKRDDRSEHGQVRSQRKARNRPAGTSTGETKDSRAVGRPSW